MTEDLGRRRTEASLATERLRSEIVTGVVAPGAKLKLVSLAERYAISRGPLREAATRLAAEGLVTIEDQRGFRVAAISREDLLDVTQTRQRIEILALRDSIAHGDLAWEGRVMAACHMLERVTTPDLDQNEDFRRHHGELHEALVAACPSQYPLRFRERLYALSQRYRNLAANSAPPIRGQRDVAGEHQAIAEAAVARDVETACERLHNHLARTADVLIAAYPMLFGSAS
ncbi:MAG: GntR family transcriptional regulator [Myxococcales bacterium]|nr:GntR family transcriptional regulator [Myxococcales bacterium]